jgi:hypothetical protein
MELRRMLSWILFRETLFGMHAMQASCFSPACENKFFVYPQDTMGKGTGKGGQKVAAETLPFSKPQSLQNLKNLGKITLDEVKKHRKELCMCDQAMHKDSR